MKRWILGVAALMIVAGAEAQVLSALSLQGGVTTTAEAYHTELRWRWSSGSGRGGGGAHHKIYYTVAVVDQLVNNSATIDATLPTQSITSLNTFTTPNFQASGTSLATYQDTGSASSLSVLLTGNTSALPQVTAPSYVLSNVVVNPSFTFTVAADTEVSINLGGSLGAGATYSITPLGSLDGDPTLTYKSPNVYDLIGGNSFKITVNSIGVNGIVGSASTGSLSVNLNFAKVNLNG